MSKSFSHPGNQRGAVLVVALVMLLLLTMISLTSMRGTALQENMAGNLRESNTSLQAAEAALRAGEQLTRSKFLDGSINVLESMSEISATHTGFSNVSDAPKLAKDPAFSIIKLASLRTSTEAGVSLNEEGVLVRVEGSGAGFSVDSNNQPSVQSQLRSTFLVEQ